MKTHLPINVHPPLHWQLIPLLFWSKTCQFIELADGLNIKRGENGERWTQYIKHDILVK